MEIEREREKERLLGRQRDAIETNREGTCSFSLIISLCVCGFTTVA